MAQYTPRLAAIRLSSVENRSRPQLRIALRAHRLAAASGPQAGVALSVMETIGAPVTLAAGLVSLRLRSYARTANWYSALQYAIATALNIVRCASQPTGVLFLDSRY